jgi:drug/metabolite transporter (DMT)-like permease
MWVAWGIVVLCGVISIILLMGAGSFLIAGYNTASKEEKRKYDAKKLCRVAGGGFGIITAIFSLQISYEFHGLGLPAAIEWLAPVGYLVTIAVMALLANTICKKKI